MLCPSRTGELAVQTGEQAVWGQPLSWTPVATDPSDNNPRWYLPSLESVPWKTLLRELWRAAQASSAQSFGTRTAQNERRPAPPPHRLRLLEQLFPRIWFGVRDLLFSPSRPGDFPQLLPGSFSTPTAASLEAPGRDPAWAPPSGRGEAEAGRKPVLLGREEDAKTQKKRGSASSLSHRRSPAGGGCPIPGTAAGAREPPRGAAEVGFGSSKARFDPRSRERRGQRRGQPPSGAGVVRARLRESPRGRGENIPGGDTGIPAALGDHDPGCPFAPVRAGGGGAVPRGLGKKVYQGIFTLQLLLKI